MDDKLYFMLPKVKLQLLYQIVFLNAKIAMKTACLLHNYLKNLQNFKRRNKIKTILPHSKMTFRKTMTRLK